MLKRIGLVTAALAVATFASVPAANATPVTFNVTGVFGGGVGCNTSSCTVGSTTLTFTGNTFPSLLTGSSFAFGTFDSVGGATSSDFTGVPFTMTVHQSVPGSGTGDFLATLSGTIKFNQSKAFVLFSTLQQNILGIKYILTEADNGVAGRSNLGVPGNPDTVEGRLVPEPASILLLGLGFLGCAAAARRRMNLGQL